MPIQNTKGHICIDESLKMMAQVGQDGYSNEHKVESMGSLGVWLWIARYLDVK